MNKNTKDLLGQICVKEKGKDLKAIPPEFLNEISGGVEFISFESFSQSCTFGPSGKICKDKQP